MPYVSTAVLDGALNIIKNTAAKLLLVSGFNAGDSYATVQARKLAEVNMASTDFTISDMNPATAGRKLTSATGKSALASASSNQYGNGTATGGSVGVAGGAAGTLVDSSKAWAVNEHVTANGRAVTITAGTGVGQAARILSNTATTLTVAGGAFAVAPDATSTYRITDDLQFVLTNGVDTIVWNSDESTNMVVTAANTVNFPALTYNALQPTS